MMIKIITAKSIRNNRQQRKQNTNFEGDKRKG